MINDIARLPSLRAALDELLLPGADSGDGTSITETRAEIAGIEAKWSNADLLRAYQRTDGEPGDPEADALLAEIERRGLDT